MGLKDKDSLPCQAFLVWRQSVLFMERKLLLDFSPPLLICLLPLLHPMVNQLYPLKHEIQLLLLLGLAMIVFNSQKIIQHLKSTIKKFSHSVSLWVLAGSKEVILLSSSYRHLAFSTWSPIFFSPNGSLGLFLFFHYIQSQAYFNQSQNERISLKWFEVENILLLIILTFFEVENILLLIILTSMYTTNQTYEYEACLYPSSNPK